MRQRPIFLGPTKPSDWPEADQRAWRRALEEDPLAPGGAGAAGGWRPSTIRFAEINYGVWLAWLARKGLLGAGTDPAARATRENLREFLADMRWAGLSEHSVATRLGGVATAFRAIAPEFDARFISRAAGRVRGRAKPLRDFEAKFRPPEELLELGHQLMARADNADLPEVDRALFYRDGLLIVLMVHRPLRISNMAAIKLDQHLQKSRGGYRLAFEAAEMKSARPYACVFPDALVEALERYLMEFRSLLSVRCGEGKASSALWLGPRGQPLKPCAVEAALRRRTRTAFGEPMGPHLLRHIVATTVAEHSPENVSEVPTILGHQNLETSERHYIHANAIAAGRKLQEAFAARRTGGPPSRQIELP